MNQPELTLEEGQHSPCSVVANSSASTRLESLLLAPMDSAAESAITHALKTSGYTFWSRWDMIGLDVCRNDLPGLSAMIEVHLPHTLQCRIKAVFTESANSPHEMMKACLRAEILPVFFEHAEVAWVEHALNDGWLYSVFQPIVSWATGAEHGFEALMRARNPETNEIISAGQLIHACERLNLQHQLDQHARVCAVRDAASLGRPDAKFFINFFPNTIYDPELSLRNTLQMAEDNGIKLSQLVFEVVEREQIDSPSRLRHILEFYREKGAGIALDDIGSGFSSLHYLADLHPDYVKIDRHLVSSAPNSPSARHTLESIVGLAKKLNVKVVAEGIETREEMEVCVSAGVEFLQGYLFARPAYPPEALRKDVTQLFKRAA